MTDLKPVVTMDDDDADESIRIGPWKVGELGFVGDG